MDLVHHVLLLRPESVADGIDLKLCDFEVPPKLAAQLLHLRLVR